MRATASPIKSTKDLASKLGLELNVLEVLAETRAEARYRPKEAPAKRDGSPRIVFCPSPEIRKVQRRFAKRIFRPPNAFIWPPHLFGGIANESLQTGESSRDYVMCATLHCGARSLLKLDIRSFFDSIDETLVFSVFAELMGWSECAANLATNLCTREGTLPQGGLTSSFLALLCLHDVEGVVAMTLQRKGMVYTRYVDDITVSSKVHGQDFGLARKLVEDMLSKKGLSLNLNKVQELRSGTVPLEVHSLRVDSQAPRLPQKEIRRIRAATHQLKLTADELGVRSIEYRHRFNRVMGIVNKLARVQNNQHPRLIRQLDRIRPLPSQLDYDIAQKTSHRLREAYDKIGDGFRYWTAYNQLMERLNLIGTENKKWANTLRAYMKSHFPPKFDRG